MHTQSLCDFIESTQYTQSNSWWANYLLITNECFHNNQINSINQHNNYNNKGLYIIIIEKAIHKHTEGNELNVKEQEQSWLLSQAKAPMYVWYRGG